MAPSKRASNGEEASVPPRVLVLIFDGDEATCLLYHRELSQQYDVLLCTKEQDALQILRTEDIEALVLEPATLDDDQWSFLSLVRTTAATKQLAIIICSTLDERRRAAAFGIEAYLIKPVSASMLLQTVAAVLAKSDLKVSAT